MHLTTKPCLLTNISTRSTTCGIIFILSSSFESKTPPNILVIKTAKEEKEVMPLFNYNSYLFICCISSITEFRPQQKRYVSPLKSVTAGFNCTRIVWFVLLMSFRPRELRGWHGEGTKFGLVPEAESHVSPSAKRSRSGFRFRRKRNENFAWKMIVEK